jgi:hypothetical protein
MSPAAKSFCAFADRAARLANSASFNWLIAFVTCCGSIFADFIAR